MSAVRFGPDEVIAYYDGRASAAENYEERTGVAVGESPEVLTAIGAAPIGGPPDGAAACATCPSSTSATAASAGTTS